MGKGTFDMFKAFSQASHGGGLRLEDQPPVLGASHEFVAQLETEFFAEYGRNDEPSLLSELDC